MKLETFEKFILIIWGIPIILATLVLIFNKKIFPYSYECVSRHKETIEIEVCDGNLYHKVCVPEKDEREVCDEYKKIRR